MVMVEIRTDNGMYKENKQQQMWLDQARQALLTKDMQTLTVFLI